MGEKNNAHLDQLAWSLATLGTGIGLIALVWALSPIPIMELLTWALYVLLPLAALAVGLGLVSAGTINGLRAAGSASALNSRVNDWVIKLRKDPSAKPEPATAEAWK